jgi:hypothetical protein
MYVWSHGLGEFLRHSNEDAVCSNFITDLVQRTVHRLWPDCTENIRIADIGCGPGSKAIEIARGLHRHGITSHWDLVDIDHMWANEIQKNIRATGSPNHMRLEVHCPCSAEAWSDALSMPPHIAQFIHVPYDDETEETVYTLGKTLTAEQAVVLVAAEHPASDLSKIRRTLAARGHRNLPKERVTSLVRRFRAEGLHVKQHLVARKFLDIGPAHQLRNADWLWSLIFGGKHNPDDTADLVSLISDYVRLGAIASADACILDIPDFLITVRQRT